MKNTGSRSKFWLLGPAAAFLSTASIIGFAALRDDGYSHGTKAVSELGVIGAPMGMAFNLLGFIVPGILLIGFAIDLWRASGRKTGPTLLVLSGAMLALAGLAPADMDDAEAATTVLHYIGAIGSGTFWALSLFWLGPLLQREFKLERWGRITPWFALFLFANIGWQIAFRATGLVLPGWGQRIGFLGYFAWIAITGVLLWRKGLEKRSN